MTTADQALRTAQRRAGQVDPIIRWECHQSERLRAIDLRSVTSMWEDQDGDVEVSERGSGFLIHRDAVTELGGVAALYQRWRAARGA